MVFKSDNDGFSAFSDKFLKRLFLPLRDHKRIALAVSGGPDSMTMMHTVHRWQGLVRFACPVINVLTVDHGLRPEAVAEAEFVSEVASRLNFKHRTLTWLGDKPRTAVQSMARDARYRLMIDDCHKHQATCLLLAHTRDDQVETVLMRLERGSGLDGLSGMSAQKMRDGVVLFRPLLDISKARLLRHASQEKIIFVNDPSNDNLAYERPKLRQKIAAYRQIGLRRDAIARSARRLERVQSALIDIVDSYFVRYVTISELGFAQIDHTQFDTMPTELKIRVFKKTIDLVGGEAPLPKLPRIEALFNLDANQTLKINQTLGGCLVTRSAYHYRFYRENGRFKPDTVRLEEGKTIIWDDRFQIDYSSKNSSGLIIDKLGVKGWLQIKAASGLTTKIQRERQAFLTTPALWLNNRLIMAPLLKFKSSDCVMNESEIRIGLAPNLRSFVKTR